MYVKRGLGVADNKRSKEVRALRALTIAVRACPSLAGPLAAIGLSMILQRVLHPTAVKRVFGGARGR